MFGWRCVVTYSEDPSDVLARAQKDAFAARAYGKPYARGKPVAGSIAELRRACAEDGTNSILDVRSFGDAPGPGVAGPFPPGTSSTILGTKRPTLEDVEAHEDDLRALLRRGEAGYLLVYAHGADRPSHVYFIGLSFD